MVRETGVQSQVESYQRLQKWYLMPPCLTLSIIRHGPRVKWTIPGKGVAPSPTPLCSRYWKESLQVALDYNRLFMTMFDAKNSGFSFSTKCSEWQNFFFSRRSGNNGYSTFPKLQDWNLTIRWFNVIFIILVGCGSHTPQQRSSRRVL